MPTIPSNPNLSSGSTLAQVRALELALALAQPHRVTASPRPLVPTPPPPVHTPPLPSHTPPPPPPVLTPPSPPRRRLAAPRRGVMSSRPTPTHFRLLDLPREIIRTICQHIYDPLELTQQDRLSEWWRLALIDVSSLCPISHPHHTHRSHHTHRAHHAHLPSLMPTPVSTAVSPAPARLCSRPSSLVGRSPVSRDGPSRLSPAGLSHLASGIWHLASISLNPHFPSSSSRHLHHQSFTNHHHHP